MKRFPIVFCPVLLALLASAPRSLGQEGTDRLWAESSNAASLGATEVSPANLTQAVASFEGGSFRRAQQSGSVISYGGNSRGTHTLGGLRLSGNFAYMEERHSDHAWSDVSDPYSGNPYILGGDIPGHYSRQTFDFGASCASLRLWDRLWIGASLDYGVGDFSRTDDPRTRSLSARYGLYPGVVADLGGGRRAGLSLGWLHHKEKMVKAVAKSGQLDAFKYYDYRGLADYVPVGLLMLSRRYIGDDLSAALQGSGREWFAEAGIRWRHEDVVGDSSETPGDWAETSLFLSGAYILGDGPVRDLLRIGVDFASGAAHRTLQEQVVELSADGIMQTYWKTLMSKIYYRTSDLGGRLCWERSRSDGSSLNAALAWDGSSRVILLPRSEMVTGAVSAKAGVSGPLLPSLLGEASIGCSFPAGNSLSLSDELAATPVIRDNVVIPDYEFFCSRTVNAGAGGTFRFRGGFVRTRFGWVQSLDGLGGRYSVSVVIGI